MIYSFSPDDPYEKRRRKRKTYKERREEKDGINWRAPEHMALTKDMARDFPRDSLGFPLRGTKRDVLVLDPRPTIMKQNDKQVDSVERIFREMD